MRGHKLLSTFVRVGESWKHQSLIANGLPSSLSGGDVVVSAAQCGSRNCHFTDGQDWMAAQVDKLHEGELDCSGGGFLVYEQEQQLEATEFSAAFAILVDAFL